MSEAKIKVQMLVTHLSSLVQNIPDMSIDEFDESQNELLYKFLEETSKLIAQNE